MLAEAQRRRAAAGTLLVDLEQRQLVEVGAVRRVELQAPAGASQRRVQAPRPQLEAGALGGEPQGARARSDGRCVHGDA